MFLLTRLFNRLFRKPLSAEEQQALLEEIFKGPHSIAVLKELEALSKTIDEKLPSGMKE